MWNGLFSPMVKHHLGTGDIRNHIAVDSVELIDAEPERPYSLEALGTGQYMFLVSVSFIDGDGEEYEFVYEDETPQPNTQDIIDQVANYLQ